MVDPSYGNSHYMELTGDDGAYFKGLSFNPLDGSLWGSDGTTIFNINTLTREKTSIGVITTDWYDRAHGLAFDVSGNLFASITNLNNNETSYFAVINQTSGESSLIGEIGYPEVGGLAIHPKTIVTDIKELNYDIPEVFALKQNYPNPFNPTTTIKYDLATASRVSIIIYDLLGREVIRLVDDKVHAGHYEIVWDGKNEHGYRIAGGLYFYRMDAEGLNGKNKYIMTKKLLLLK